MASALISWWADSWQLKVAAGAALIAVAECWRRRSRRTLTGVVCLSHGGQLLGESRGGVREYRNLPYAEDPVGPLRFAPPQPKAAWPGLLDCSGPHAPAAPQLGTGIGLFIQMIVEGLGLPAWKRWLLQLVVKIVPLVPAASEECLRLSLRRPDTSEVGLPVMVWIHGGDHQDGAGNDGLTDHPALALEGRCIVVYINYRLGLFGWFAHEELASETCGSGGGDMGMLDTVCALKWIRDEIGSFGGDPDRVTVFGESAGGMSCILLMAMPAAEGLFHRAIVQSPGQTPQMLSSRTCSWRHLEAAETKGRQFADRVVGPGPGQLDRLRALPHQELSQAYRQFTLEGDRFGFFPVVGGSIPCHPLTAFQRGSQHKVPMLIGCNADEGLMMTGFFHTNPFTERHASCLYPMPAVNAAWTRSEKEVESWSASEAARLCELYPGISGLGPSATRAKGDLSGDFMFVSRSWELARLHARSGAATFAYMFKMVPKSGSQTIGSYHASELEFVHDGELFVKNTGQNSLKFGRDIRAFWARMAHSGDPNTAELLPDSAVRWARFSDSEAAEWLEMDQPGESEPVFEMVLVPRREKLAMLSAHTDKLVKEFEATRAESLIGSNN